MNGMEIKSHIDEELENRYVYRVDRVFSLLATSFTWFQFMVDKGHIL